MTGLEALRESHLAEARARAAELVAGARATSREVLEKAKAEADEVIRMAEEEGNASAERDTGHDWTSARRRARAIRLAAQRDAYEELRLAAVAAAVGDPRSDGLRHAVAAEARMRLGPGALVNVNRAGVTATRRTKHVGWTVDDAVGEVLGRLGPRIEELWR